MSQLLTRALVLASVFAVALITSSSAIDNPNDSIITNGLRRKISLTPDAQNEVVSGKSRTKRELTKEQLAAFIKALREGKRPKGCAAGSEERTERGKNICFKCPPGNFWSGVTRKCSSCPVGTYNVNEGAIGKCIPCSPGTSTAVSSAGNATLCVEQCPFGYISRNGLMQPVNFRACQLGYYANKSGMKQCTPCPAKTTTSYTGATNISYCQAQCPIGFSSHNGLAPCNKCAQNTFQTKIGQRVCVRCLSGKITLAAGSSSPSQCITINECDSNPCRNGGYCIDGTNKFICNCPPGWAGVQCNINVDECASKPCWSGASCVDKVNDFQCMCPPGFKGKLCNLNINECQSNPCSNGGDCSDLIGDFECSCRAGYGGKTCKVNQDDCTPGICWNGGTCSDKLNGFICKCARGFRGEQCNENLDDCGSNNCQNGATCVDGVNAYTCKCAPGFSGLQCQINNNECLSQPCKHSGQCTDAINDYKCTCRSFWGGKDCSRKLSDCFNLNMEPNTVEDYVVYDPAAKIPAISEITVRFSMNSNDKGLQAHYGSIISYGLPGREGMFNIRAFPEQMLQVNGDDWLTGVDVTDGKWNTVCMTWRVSDGGWRAYKGAGTQLAMVSDYAGTGQQFLSKGKRIDGGGKFVIGQLFQGKDEEFNDSNIFQGQLSGLSIWYKWDQCMLSSTPDVAWPNMVYNGRVVTRTNRGMVKTGVRRDTKC